MEKSDQELISETLNGILGSFDMLMERYQRLVYKVAYGFGKNQQSTMDISQNVFLKAYEKLSSFRGESSFKSWLMRITYNEGINWSKRNNRHQESDIDEASMKNQYKDLSQEDELLARENRAQLLKCLLALNTRYRLAVVLRYFNDMPVREIAGVLECSEGVVKNMLFRSLQQLKNNLSRVSLGGIDGTL